MGTTTSSLPSPSAPSALPSISTLGSVALLVNTITGPGLVALCAAFQDGGWLPSILWMALFFLATALASGFTAEAMSYVPGNERGGRAAALGGSVEFSTLARRSLPRKGYIAFTTMVIFSLVTTNISSIIEVSQTMDAAFLAAGNGTCALRFYPDPAALCISDADASPGDSVFGSSFVLSLGFVATLVVTSTSAKKASEKKARGVDWARRRGRGGVGWMCVSCVVCCMCANAYTIPVCWDVMYTC